VPAKSPPPDGMTREDWRKLKACAKKLLRQLKKEA